MTLNTPSVVNRLLSAKTLVEAAGAGTDDDRARDLLRQARGYLRVTLAELGDALDEGEAPATHGAMADALDRFRDQAKAQQLAGLFVVGIQNDGGAESECITPTPAAVERLYGVLADRCFRGMPPR